MFVDEGCGRREEEESARFILREQRWELGGNESRLRGDVDAGRRHDRNSNEVFINLGEKRDESIDGMPLVFGLRAGSRT